MSSVRARGNKCFTRSNKSGATYVVCDDPPKGSRGQAGVYRAANPTGKQDGRTKRKEAEIDKQRAFNRVRKSMMNKEYQTGIAMGDGRVVNQRTPKSAPSTSSMKKDLLDKGIAPKFLDGMGRLYIYTRWANDTKDGKAFLKKEKLEKPEEFAGVDAMDEIGEQAEDILDGDADDFDAKMIDDFPSRQDAYDYEAGRAGNFTSVSAMRRSMEERTLRYKHYLELAGKPIPAWVKDISD